MHQSWNQGIEKSKQKGYINIWLNRKGIQIIGKVENKKDNQNFKQKSKPKEQKAKEIKSKKGMKRDGKVQKEKHCILLPKLF